MNDGTKFFGEDFEKKDIFDKVQDLDKLAKKIGKGEIIQRLLLTQSNDQLIKAMQLINFEKNNF